RCGATFVVRLPLADAATTSPETAVPVEAEVENRRILVVDDNDDAAASLALLLSHAGHEVRDVRDGRSGLEAAGKFALDVVLRGIGVTDIKDSQIARRLRAGPNSQELRLIAIGGYGQRADRRRSRDAGIDYHLTKPVDSAAIAACLR